MKNPGKVVDLVKSDLLQEARLMLTEPSRDTARKIIIGVNALFLIATIAHISIQLYTSGGLPHPLRDGIIFPIAFVVQAYSLYYNLNCFRKGIEGDSFQNKLTAWITVIICKVFGLVIIHSNPNLATSFLFDASFSLLVLFIAGLILGRIAAFVWFCISMISLFIVWQNIGPEFTYYLKTPAQIESFERLLQIEDPAAVEELREMEQEMLAPIKSIVFASIWFIYFLFGLLIVFFESTMVSQILKAIPGVVNKINIASEERNLLTRENFRMGTELDVARRIQSLVLPTEQEMLACKNLDVFAYMEPATEVGGDFVEVLPQENGDSIIAIGDVTDHGLPSGLVMLMTQTALRTCLDNTSMSLDKALSSINLTLFKNVQERMKDFRNLSLSILRFQDGFVDICGQHESILLLPADSDEVEVISTMDLGIYIGLIDDISEHVSTKRIKIGKGDLMILYSDGITEAENSKGQLYGLDPVSDVLLQNRFLSSRELGEKILSEVYNFIGTATMFDDISLIVIKYK